MTTPTERHEGVLARSLRAYVHLADSPVTLSTLAAAHIHKTRCGRSAVLLPPRLVTDLDRPCTNCERSWVARTPRRNGLSG